MIHRNTGIETWKLRDIVIGPGKLRIRVKTMDT